MQHNLQSYRLRQLYKYKPLVFIFKLYIVIEYLLYHLVLSIRKLLSFVLFSHYTHSASVCTSISVSKHANHASFDAVTSTSMISHF